MSPYYVDPSVTVYAGDCLDVLRELPDASVDAVVTDPPYGLEFMGREWDSFARQDTTAQRGKAGGFGADKGQPWDNARQGTKGVRSTFRCRACQGWSGSFSEARAKRQKACDCETPDFDYAGAPAQTLAFGAWCQLWAAECLRVLKPGGHLLAMGGSRTYHRLACAVEDAGFEIRDSIAWLYGSGFPKSLDVGKAIDKAAGAEREVLRPRLYEMTDGGGYSGNLNTSKPRSESAEITAPATPDAERWQGWGTALKPAHEPVICARKPFSAVPLDQRLVATVHHALAGLLWLSLSPARRAELTSPSSRAERDEGACVSALVAAAMATSPDESARTDTFSSPATASTCSNIALSWNSILGALSAPTSMSTTSTRSSTTTGLRILSSLLAPVTSLTTMPACECLSAGQSALATSAGLSSSDDWLNWLHRLTTSAPENAGESTGPAVASALASFAETLSSEASGSSAVPSATTGAASSTSPAHEPIVVARKPLAGTVAANVLAHGTGALNVDGCRVGMSDSDYDRLSAWAGRYGGTKYADGNTYAKGMGDVQPPNPAGRWPANVVLDESQAAALDQMSGESVSQGGSRGAGGQHGAYSPLGAQPDVEPGFGDSGGASRFYYTAKADAGERVRINGVAHPTVKPLSLMRWLVRLVCPPGGTVLEPFAGSGTTVEACILEGFRCIAVEREADYLPLIVQRINRRRDPVAAVRSSGEDGGLFDLLDADVPPPVADTRAGEASAGRRYTTKGGTNFAMKPGRRYRDGGAA